MNSQKSSTKEKSIKKALKKAASASRRNMNDKWYKETKVEFGNVTKFYQITKEIGRGAYGVVYEAFMLHPETKEVTNKRVAVKMFYNTLYPQLVLMELYFLQLVKDAPWIVRLQNFMYENNQYFAITDYYNSIHFEKIMHPVGTPLAPTGTILAPMIEIKSYVYALLKGLASLHSLGVVHRDIKQANFLYDPETKKGVIIDFGLAEISAEMRAKVVKDEEELPRKEVYKKIIDLQKKVGENKIGTEGFMPPEQVLKKERQSYGVDIWSAGVIFLEFLTAKHTLFKNLRLRREKQGNQQQEPVEYCISLLCCLALIFGKKKVLDMARQCGFKVVLPNDIQEEQLPWRDIVYHAEFDDNTMDLLDKMLKLNPDERISSRDALLHPFFDEVRRDD